MVRIEPAPPCPFPASLRYPREGPAAGHAVIRTNPAARPVSEMKPPLEREHWRRSPNLRKQGEGQGGSRQDAGETHDQPEPNATGLLGITPPDPTSPQNGEEPLTRGENQAAV